MTTNYGINNIIADGSAVLHIDNTQISALDFTPEDGRVGYLEELSYEPVSITIHDLQQEFMSIKDYYPSDSYYSASHLSETLRKLIDDVEMCKKQCGINIENNDEFSDDNQVLDQFLGEFINKEAM